MSRAPEAAAADGGVMTTVGASVLVIGFGNPGRRDDGIGPALAARLAERRLPGVRVESAYQLNVEDAASVAEHDVVVFADASLDATPPFTLQRIEPCRERLTFTSHSQRPETVLGLAHDVFGAATRGYVLAVRGYAFREFGETLSDGAQANLAATLDYLEAALGPGGELFRPVSEAARTGP